MLKLKSYFYYMKCNVTCETQIEVELALLKTFKMSGDCLHICKFSHIYCDGLVMKFVIYYVKPWSSFTPPPCSPQRTYISFSPFCAPSGSQMQ